MNEIFLLYLWTRLDSLNVTIGIITIILIIMFATLFIFGVIARGCAYSEEDSDWRRGTQNLLIAKKYAWVLIVFLFISNALPTQKDVAIIAGGWIVSKAIQSDQAKEIGDKTWKLIQGKLDDELSKLATPAKK